MADAWLEAAKITAERELHEKGFLHLHARLYGQHLVIYSEAGDERDNRARLTQTRRDVFRMGMANHHGRWEPAPFTGTLSEMLTVLMEQFGFILAK